MAHCTVGTIVCTESNAAPSDAWLPCDGRALAEGEFRELQLALLKGRGTADRLPDFRGIWVPGRGELWATAAVQPLELSLSHELSWWIRVR
jgi:hypothetical protein